MKGILVIILFFIGQTVFAQSKGLKVFVELSPAGSFEISSSSIKGKVSKQGSTYTADKITAAVKNFSTGLDLRDSHLKKKLEEEKYPKIEITDAKANGSTGEAMIQVRNVKKKVSFKMKELSGKFVKVMFNLSLKDFNFTGINYMGVGVQDQVKVEATLGLGK